MTVFTALCTISDSAHGRLRDINCQKWCENHYDYTALMGLSQHACLD